MPDDIRKKLRRPPSGIRQEKMTEHGTFALNSTYKPPTTFQTIGKWATEDVGPFLGMLLGDLGAMGTTALETIGSSLPGADYQRRLRAGQRRNELIRGVARSVSATGETAGKGMRFVGREVLGVGQPRTSAEQISFEEGAALVGLLAPVLKGVHTGSMGALNVLGRNTMGKGFYDLGDFIHPRRTAGRFAETLVDPRGAFNASAAREYYTDSGRHLPLQKPIRAIRDPQMRSELGSQLFRRGIDPETGYVYEPSGPYGTSQLADDIQSVGFSLEPKYGSLKPGGRSREWNLDPRHPEAEEFLSELGANAAEIDRGVANYSVPKEGTNLAPWKVPPSSRYTIQQRYAGGPFGRYNIAVDPVRKTVLGEDIWAVRPYSTREVLQTFAPKTAERFGLVEAASNYGTTRGGMLQRMLYGAFQQPPTIRFGRSYKHYVEPSPP